MSSDAPSVRCPHCQAQYDLAAIGPGGRAECESCGESFPLARADATAARPGATVLDDVQRRWEDSIATGAAPEASIKEARADHVNAVLAETPLPRALSVAGNVFVLLDLLGAGGMGLVYRARQNSVDRQIAVKVIRPELADRQGMRDQFLIEAVVTGDLDHPNVIPIHDVGVAPDGTLFYAMKEVRGTPWSKVIASRSLEENLEILLKVADAVAYAHSKGVVHRDLKPENVMLGDYGEVLVMDWGLAVSVSANANAKAGRLPSRSGAAGTPAYLAPEMALGEGDRIGPASDIYLLGGILYESVSGLRPHAGNDAMACLKAAACNEIQSTDRKGELVRIALKAMATAPEDRYPDVKAFQQALRDYRRHAESIALATRAREHLAQVLQGQIGDAYRECHEAISGYRQALALWADNVPAVKGLRRARETLAQRALERGDLALAQTQRENYANVIALADRKIVAGEIVQAEEMLWNTPKDLRGWEWGRCLHLCHQELLTLRGHVSAVHSVAFSPDGTRLVSTDGGPLARVWDVTTGRESLRLNSGGAICAVFSPDGRRIAIGHWDTSVVLWDAASGTRLLTLSGQKTEGRTIAFSPDGTCIASGGRGEASQTKDTEVLLWDTSTGQRLTTLKGHRDSVDSLGFSPDGQRLVTASREDFTVRIWEVRSGKELLAMDIPNAWRAGFSPDGASVYVSGAPAFAGMWDATTGEQRVTFSGHTATAYAAAVAADGGRVVTGSADRTARLWDPRTGRELLRIWAQAPVASVALAPDGRLLATGGSDGTIRLWDATREGGTAMVAGSPAGFVDGHSRLVTVGGGCPIQSWDAATGRCLRSAAQAVDAMSACALSADGLRLVTGHEDGRAAIWEVETGRRFSDLTGHTGRVYSVAFSPDGKRVVSSAGHWADGGPANTVFVWDAATGQRLSALTGHGKLAWSARFSPDGERVLTANQDGAALIWDAASGRELSVFRLTGKDTGVAMAAAFAPDGRRIVTGLNDVVVIWDVDSRQPLRVLSGHSSTVISVLFSPDGHRVFTTGRDLTLRVWDAETGRELLALQHPASYEVRLADVSADGRALAVSAASVLVLNTLDWTLSREDIGPWKLVTYQAWRQGNGPAPTP